MTLVRARDLRRATYAGYAARAGALDERRGLPSSALARIKIYSARKQSPKIAAVDLVHTSSYTVHRCGTGRSSSSIDVHQMA